jgi:hypothetical protein
MMALATGELGKGGMAELQRRFAWFLRACTKGLRNAPNVVRNISTIAR